MSESSPASAKPVELKLKSLLLISLQIAFLACALLMASWSKATVIVLLGVALLSIGILARAKTTTASTRGRINIGLAAGWGGTLLAVAGTVLNRATTLDFYHSILCWLIAAAILSSERGRHDRHWKALAVLWSFLGASLWLAIAYLQNLPWLFHVGVTLNVGLLILARCWFHPPSAFIQVINTLILLLIGLPLADSFIRPSYRSNLYLDPKQRPYSYAAAKGDPATFARWCHCFQSQWDQMAAAVFLPDPSAKVAVRLRPASHGKLFDSVIQINKLGFRGHEISLDKGAAYRIVALGESTTFGCTLNPGEKPWPELLQEMIEERLHPPRPVEVINAGVPANHLEHNLIRLPSEILPLHPDVLISYHGYNGFCLLRESMPTEFGQMPPAYKQRPLKLLSVLEYRFKVANYKRNQATQFQTNPPDLSNPLETRYARAYRNLIQCANTNGIALVLANFSMALNTDSVQDVVAFYRAGHASAYWNIRANLAHSKIVKELTKENPGIGYVDTHADLDGVHEKFIDLVHLTQDGRQQLAENIYNGIRPLLQRELANESAGAQSKP